jgi:hypothetical protein
VALCLLPALLAWSSCRRAGPSLDVRPEARISATALPATAPLEITYIWRVAEDFRPDGADYTAFVHFRGEEGGLLWDDDHAPEIPTSRWAAGQAVEYMRTAFIPRRAPLEEITVTVGLYRSGEGGGKVRLAGRQGRSLEYEVARFEVLPAAELPEIVYAEGWHDPEVEAGNPEGETWRWSQREAACLLERPERPAFLYLQAQAPVEFLGGPQDVAFELEGKPLDSFTIGDTDRVSRKISLPPDAWKGKDQAILVLHLGRSVVPAETGKSTDARELGLKIYRMVVF